MRTGDLSTQHGQRMDLTHSFRRMARLLEIAKRAEATEAEVVSVGVVLTTS